MKQRLPHSAGSIRFSANISLPKRGFPRNSAIIGARKRSYESAANHAHRISSLRIFCKYLSSVGIPAYIPPHGLTRHPEKYDAHIYTPDELERFFTAVDASRYCTIRVSLPGPCHAGVFPDPLYKWNEGIRVTAGKDP